MSVYAEPINNLILDLLSANPDLTGSQAHEYARSIIAAESREDYELMYAIQQEALYGRKKTAA